MDYYINLLTTGHRLLTAGAVSPRSVVMSFGTSSVEGVCGSPFSPALRTNCYYQLQFLKQLLATFGIEGSSDTCHSKVTPPLIGVTRFPVTVIIMY